MAANYDELTIQWEEDGEVVVEELEKIIIQKGVWCTVLYRFRQLDNKTGEFGPAKAALRRYQKSKGFYRKKDSINISEKSAPLLIEHLHKWFDA